MSASEELRRADAVATALHRGLAIQPIAWEELLAIAQQELGRHQQQHVLRGSEELYDEQVASGLIAAARIIKEVAERPQEEPSALAERGAETTADKVERHLLLILASCAFGMYGNFLSAAAVQRSLDRRLITSEGQWLALAISNPIQIASALSSELVRGATREFLEQLNHFLQSGDERQGSRLIPNLEELTRATCIPAEVVFLRCCRLALSHILTLATANLYRLRLGNIFSGYIRQLIIDGRTCLLPPQYRLIAGQRALETTENTIITIPTSTGKTLIGELIIAARLRRDGDIAIYVAPYIALGRQVYESMRRHAPRGVDVRGYFGNFNSHIEPLNAAGSTIIIATPERLDAILRTQQLYSRVRTVVFDEAHGLENGVRGARLEALITRLRLQQARHDDIRIILLSAVLSDVEPLRMWLGESAVHLHDTWRPTARRLGIWLDSGELAWLYGTDPIRPTDREPSSFLGKKTLPWPSYIRPAESFQQINAQKLRSFQNAAYLARYLEASIGGPVLLACATKANTRGLAAALASELHPKEAVLPDIQIIKECISSEYPHLAPLAQLVEKGVAYHNASLPAQIRVLIENAIKQRAIDFIAATTTLAEGVDLPFRVTVLYDWLFGFAAGQAPMSSLLFRNIAGRCGRAGEFTEGDTIIFDNVLGSLAYTGAPHRRQAQAQLFSDPPPLQSAIVNDNVPQEIKTAIKAAVSSQLLASIPENPDEDILEEKWASSTYAAFRSSAPVELLREFRSELLDAQHGEPFAIAASPMRLTPLGTAANCSGFGPRTCRQLLQYLPTVDLRLPIDTIASELLLAFGAADEQNNYLLRDIATRKRTNFFVKADDLTAIASGWLAGHSLTDIFLRLPKAQTSRAAVTPAEWAQGQNGEPVAAQYDKFIDVTEYTFGGFLPWLLRAVQSLAPFCAAAVVEYDWGRLADQFEASRDVDAVAIDEVVAFGSTE